MNAITVEFIDSKDIHSVELKSKIAADEKHVITLTADVGVVDNRLHRFELAYFLSDSTSEAVGFFPDGEQFWRRTLRDVEFEEALVDFVTALGVALTREFRAVGGICRFGNLN